MEIIVITYRRAALEKWKQYNGPRATYRKLIAAFERAGRQDFASKVYEIAGRYYLKYHYCALQVSCLEKVREWHLSLSLYKLKASVTL